MAVAGALVATAPIPFWDKEIGESQIALTSVAGVNIAAIVITLSVSVSYDHQLGWLRGLPLPAGAVVASILWSRVVVALAGVAFGFGMAAVARASSCG